MWCEYEQEPGVWGPPNPTHIPATASRPPAVPPAGQAAAAAAAAGRGFGRVSGKSQAPAKSVTPSPRLSSPSPRSLGAGRRAPGSYETYGVEPREASPVGRVMRRRVWLWSARNQRKCRGLGAQP
ncbi:PREDICTED: eukaryotic translation initiation factor 3 subunit F-like [Hipposideros armiger]|uniref:Eukaryotic translation initiation factor 3 subunit F-like n=1 Tax=Hipposideros armiger TaxID=186990 RepID=A0A8B7RKX2_HIPAR|nr:PREDICTED: eukaryotic translation initiation factor 3 subunit F-like [Hipposideros armiger]